MKQLILLILVLSSLTTKAQKLAPNISVGIINRSSTTSIGGQISILSNPQKQGQFGVGLGFYDLPGDAGPIIPLFVHFRAKLTKKNVAPVIDGNVGWHLYSNENETEKGGAFVNLGFGAIANVNKKVKPFFLIKFQVLQFREFNANDIYTESKADGYLNLSIGVEF